MSSVAFADRSSNRWLLGPRIDVLIGCGVAYYIVFVALSAFGPSFQAAYPAGLLPVIALALSIPHYGATLLRVYERADDQRRYRIFTLYLSVLLAMLFVAGVYNPLIASLLITVYFTWSPWHYSGQNYGISVMFLRRRGVSLPAKTKRFLHWSFITSFCLPLAEIHGLLRSGNTVNLETVSSSVQFLPIGYGPTMQTALMAIFSAAYLLTTFIALRGLLRLAPVSVLLPALLLIFTQSLWFVTPTLAQHFGLLQRFDSLSIDGADYAFFWIAIAHALQYLWISTYFSLEQGRARRASEFYLRALVAGAVIWIVPALIFAPHALGTLPFDAGLAALVAAVVNIHHFMLDGAIWKLRDGPIARILFPRGATTPDATPSQPSPIRQWSLRGLATVGVACVAVSYIGTTESHLGFRRAYENNDLARAELAYQRLQSIGRDSGFLQSQLALLQARNGSAATALQSAEEAVRLHRTETSVKNLAIVYELAGRSELAASLRREASALATSASK